MKDRGIYGHYPRSLEKRNLGSSLIKDVKKKGQNFLYALSNQKRVKPKRNLGTFPRKSCEIVYAALFGMSLPTEHPNEVKQDSSGLLLAQGLHAISSSVGEAEG